MSEIVSFDGHELALLDEALFKAAAEAPVLTRAVVAKGALNIKTDAQRRISGLKHAPAYPRSITYDSHDTGSLIYAEIGPDKSKRQGALGNILEYGTTKNAPHPHLGPAAEAEAPKFEAAMQVLAESLLDGS